MFDGGPAGGQRDEWQCLLHCQTVFHWLSQRDLARVRAARGARTGPFRLAGYIHVLSIPPPGARGALARAPSDGTSRCRYCPQRVDSGVSAKLWVLCIDFIEFASKPLRMVYF